MAMLASEVNDNTKPRKSFLSLPAELRQPILLQTYQDLGGCLLHCQKLFNVSNRSRLGSRRQVCSYLACADSDGRPIHPYQCLQEWANMLKEVHPDIVEDVDYVLEKWAEGDNMAVWP